MSENSNTPGIAVVGMAVRAPGAADLDSFWQALIEGRDCISHFADGNIDPLVPDALRQHPHFVAARGVVDDAECFDAGLFDMSANQARLLDPQQRVFLELCWHALEHAGLDPAHCEDSIGVYAGSANNTWLAALRQAMPELIERNGEFAAMLANEKDYIATRVAHKLNLTGPAIGVYTACSSSLVAIAQAWYALMNYQCDAALAGGICVIEPQAGGYISVAEGMESPDGVCRPFDADAGGTVFSSGGGCVVLKRVEDALAAGDTIHAVIRGVGINNDGADKASFTAPNPASQAAAIRLALAQAGVDAADIGYVEAHGTGTTLGDPIEVAALRDAFALADRPATCVLGSVKSNIGHLTAAAGVVGLIKAVLCLERERIPPTAHFRKPNLRIDFDATPFQVLNEIRDWPRGGTPRRAGVSSFGVGGTNAHVVLEEGVPQHASTTRRSRHVLPLSANGEDELKVLAQRMATALAGPTATPLADIAWTLAHGRRQLPLRCTVVADDAADAASQLGQPLRIGSAAPAPRQIWMFPGQGSQYPGMAAALWREEPDFRAALEPLLTVADGIDGELRGLLLDADPDDDKAAERLAQTARSQPALFLVSYAMARALEAYGLKAYAMIGHSIGEYVAACLAGVFTPEQALILVARRGALMQAQPPGDMVAVYATAEALRPHLAEGVEIACYNAAGLQVVSGSHQAMQAQVAELENNGIRHSRLKVSHAFHSPLMEGALPAFTEAVAAATPAAPQRPFYACPHGAPITAGQATDPAYWAGQILAPVRFADSLRHVLDENRPALLLEVGPGRALSTLARTAGGEDGHKPRAVVAFGATADARDGDGNLVFARALGECWSQGADVDLRHRYAGETRRQVPLPGYPFRREHYGYAAPAARAPAPSIASVAPIAAGGGPGGDATDVIVALLAEVSGEPAGSIDPGLNFVTLGLDSLLLTQFSLALEKRLGLKLRFRRLLEDLDTPEKLAAHARVELPAETWVAPEPAAPVPQPETTIPATSDPEGIRTLLASHLKLLEQQTQLLRGLAGAATPGQSVPSAATPAASRPPADVKVVAGPERSTHSAGFGAGARINLEHGAELEPDQQRWLDYFIDRYTRRTSASRSFTQRHRKVMADPRVVTGFDPRWKEMVYPIVADRSRGARLWDLDGNEYIDLLNGFGSNFLGYQPPFIAEALHAQVDAGYEIGPQHPLAAEVSELIAGFTGLPRVALCNTGSEAVMGAMRIARTVTGRDTIAIFRDSYHGIFDEAVVRGTSRFEARPAAPGIASSAVRHMLVLDYGSEEALDILLRRGSELAAIMIEPIQARHPEIRPKAFVKALRAISDQAGCALIFDEVITGFRIGPGGAQAYFGVKADIATYGKIIGGGLPFAAIAGQPRWMDALDGGDWRYGDDSQPEAGVTYFAGTFVRHPLALAAARASLKHLVQAGPGLHEVLNQRTAGLTERLNRHFRARRAPVEAVSFSSMWRLRVDEGQPLASLLFYLLRFHGLHLYEQFGCFLSTTHGEAEVDQIATRIEQSVDELLELGLLRARPGQVTQLVPPMPADTPAEVTAAAERGDPANAPMTDGQLEKWAVCQYGGDALLSYNEGVLLRLEGNLDHNALHVALEDLWARHEALRIRIDGDRESQSVSDCALPFAEVDLSGAGDPEDRLAAWSREQMATPFDLATAPLLRIHLLRLNPEAHVLHLVGHHLVLDGWSLAVFVRELAICYNARRAGREPELPPATSFIAYARDEKTRREQSAEELDYWQRELADAPEALALGHDSDGDSRLSFDADTFQRDFPATSLAAVRKRAGLASATPFSVLMSAFAILLWRLSGQRDLVLCIPFAGQALVGAGNMIGDGVNTLPLRIRIDPDENLSQLIKRVHTQLLDAADHQDTTLLSIARRLNERHQRGGKVLSRIIFNLNPHIAPPHFEGLDARLRDCRRGFCAWDLFFNFYDTGRELTLDLHYDNVQFDPEGLGEWMTAYAGLLDAMGGDADPAVHDLAGAGESLELTEAQREMCAATLMGDDANCAYNECFMLTLQGPLSPESLRNALSEVVQRHGALRLRIDRHMGRQYLLPAVEIDLPVIDLRMEDETVRQDTIAQLLDHETHTPFDFNVAPLWRALLIREADDRHRFVFTAHHLVVDGWSSAVIFSDLARSYNTDRFGFASTLPPAAPYGEFVREQLGPEVAAEMETAAEYWVNRFSGGVPTLELPVDAPRPAVKTYAAGRQVLTIDKDMYQALRKLAAQQRATLFVTLLAAFEVLLARLGNVDELVIGVPMASQALQDNEHLVAHGVNTLPLLCRLDPRDSFKDHLHSTHNMFLDAQAHQRLTFGTLVQKLRLPRDPSRTPLVSVIFNMNQLGNPFDFGDVSVASFDAPNAFYNFEMGINVIDDGESLLLECDYNADIFTAATINRWLSHYREMLSGILCNPQARLSKLPFLADAERAQLTGGAAITHVAVQHTSLHEGFEKQAARTPDAIALTCGTAQDSVELSYAELNRRADALAEHLRRLGVGPNQLVGLRCERNAELVVAILGILKAGGAYLPMDPVYPPERIAFMLRDADVRIVLTQRSLAGELADLAVTCLCLDEPLPPPLSVPPAVVSGSAQNLAYVMYTSGSTGQPKGVRITHHNVLRLFAAIDSRFDFQPDDVWTLFHSYAFDVSVFELWGALLYGGRVVVVPHDVSQDPRVFRELLVREAVTVLCQTPTAFQQLIDSDRTLPPGDFVLRHVILAGEALKLQSLRPWMDRYGDQTPRLINMYGITETTVHTTYKRIFRTDLENHAGSLIGVPISDLCVYLLDAYGQPVPVGVPGEVHVAGAGVAAGYLNRPRLTAERFLPDPFQPCDDAGVPARMYRSGDLARRLDNGELEYLGRIDHQVKIRGFRIELGEIEACLTEHPGVREATVLALGEDAEKRLVAYVVADASPDLAGTLREHLVTRLPDYMVPAAFVRMDAFPLTPNGKLDRRALPGPDGDAFARKDYEPPRGNIEIALAEIWAELLGVDRIGRYDHFFELGGHSLLAVRLINRVAALGVELPLATLFASLVFADFARVVGEDLIRSRAALPAIARIAPSSDLSLSFAQQRLWFLTQLEDSNDTYRIALVLSLHGRLDHAAFQRALATVFARHDALRSIFVERDDGEPEVRLLDAGLLPYREDDLRGITDAGETLKRLCDEEAHAPFDLARGPLMRARLIQTADEEHVVILTQHHIVFDGWSLGVLARELSELYAAFVQNRADPLPPLAIQYSDYAAWQRKWLTGERLRAQADYWREALADVPALINLPTDRPRPAQQVFEGGEVPVRLDADLARSLKRLGQQHGTTPFMTLLAAWATVLARLSGQDDFVIGTPSANRGRAEVESLIGCFINTLALRVDLSDAPTTTELLDRVRRTVLAAQDHQDLPFEQVVDILQPPRRLDHTPLFQVLFAWQTNEVASFDLPGVRVHSIDIANDSVNFDLELALGEVDDEIVGAFSYAKSLFDAATIERHRDYLLAVLRAMVAEADQPLHRVDLLPSAERVLLLETWNRTSKSYLQHLCIHQLFEQQVERSPDATAVVFEDESLSYRELNDRANRLAHDLIARGVTPDARVAICVERSLAMIVGLLAILKAGGAYVPLDPAYPSERLGYVLSDAQPCLLLADAIGRNALGQDAIDSLTVLNLESTVLDDAAGDAANPRVSELTARNLAYVIYTSGSSGKPKGVMVEHRSVVNFLFSMATSPGISSKNHLLAITSMSFDIAALELYLPLSQGARVVLASRDDAADPARLHDLIEKHGISIIQATPATWRMLLPLADHARRDLVALCGGEALTSGLSAQVSAAVLRMWNLYGPTETTIWSTCTPIVRDEKTNTPTESIGRPIANTRIYLLDGYGQPVPLGAVGEIHIGGDGVARGYFNRPELTAERFLPDPFSPRPNARMYKTGDLARYAADGNLVFLGRNDHQVKIRGFRIELGEIEACLTEHPGVREATVLALGEDAEKRLVAYVVADASPDLAGTLREHLVTRLPDYMVPAAFVRMDAFPLTPNGKLDRRALPAPADTPTMVERVKPRSASEALVVDAFNDVLERSDVGVFDNFFDLGGHSLLAAHMIANLRASTKVDLPLRNLFDQPTPERLAAAIDALAWAAGGSDRPRANEQGDREEIEL